MSDLKAHEKDMLDRMHDLADDSDVFASIVAYEWDGEMASINSPESLVRNAMITRWSVYAKCYDDHTVAQNEWEKDLINNDFYSAAFDIGE